MIDAIMTRHCNTSRDVADVTGLRIQLASARVHELLQCGFLRNTGRTIPCLRSNGTRGKGYIVFEVAR